MKKLLIIALVLGLAALAFVYLGSGKLASVKPLPGDWTISEDMIEQGRMVAIASDCMVCHTPDGGAPYAGGFHFESPFGTIWSTNITPDPEYGIGNYNYEDFVQAVQYGYSKNTGNLYPAMPYTSYRKLSDTDMNALWAYFQSLEAISQPNLDNQVIFPANIRFGLGGWNQLFFDDTDFVADPARSQAWNRGKYLVEAPGHCGECHTPRNLAFAMKPEEALQGETLEGWRAVDITPAELQRQGWTQADMMEFLGQGESRLGTTFEGMYLVIQHSLSHMPEDDLAAMTSYLLGKRPTVESNKPVLPDSVSPRAYLTAADTDHPSYPAYMNYCAGCHGVNGLGKPDAVPAMNKNTSFTSASTYNAIAVILRGLPSKRPSLTRGSVEMPAYAATLSDAEVAGLVNFSRIIWGGQSIDDVTPEQVTDVRSALQKQGLL